MDLSSSDKALLTKVNNGGSLGSNEAARLKTLAKGQTSVGRNIREFQNGNRKSPL